MEIWYINSDKSTPVPYKTLGIGGVCLKYIALGGNDGSFTLKRHFHKSYELHIVVEGSQTYETDDGTVTVMAGCGIMFAPHSKHRIIGTDFPLVKYAFAFSLQPTVLGLPKELSRAHPIPPEVISFIKQTGEERALRRETSRIITEARVLEALVRLLRSFGSEEAAIPTSDSEAEPRLSLAREYIKDNASLGVTVSDVARYCHVSERQLQRLFAADNDSAGACIRRERISAAEKLLGGTDLPLSEVAQRCGFGDEFYFGAAFKRENGMTPGAYRKAFGGKPTKRP